MRDNLHKIHLLLSRHWPKMFSQLPLSPSRVFLVVVAPIWCYLNLIIFRSFSTVHDDWFEYNYLEPQLMLDSKELQQWKYKLPFCNSCSSQWQDLTKVLKMGQLFPKPVENMLVFPRKTNLVEAYSIVLFNNGGNQSLMQPFREKIPIKTATWLWLVA